MFILKISNVYTGCTPLSYNLHVTSCLRSGAGNLQPMDWIQLVELCFSSIWQQGALPALHCRVVLGVVGQHRLQQRKTWLALCCPWVGGRSGKGGWLVPKLDHSGPLLENFANPCLRSVFNLFFHLWTPKTFLMGMWIPLEILSVLT